ncbi:DNA-binding domain-containing protein [Tanacetum coccineum]
MDGWTVVVLAKATGQKYKVFKETATGKKFYSKLQVLNYLGIADSSNSNKRKVKVAPPKDQQISTISTTPSEIPKRLYDLIQKVAKLKESIKLNSNNSDPEIAFMPHVSKPPTPLKPKPKPKPKMKKKKKIKITWRSYNYHGSYPMNKDEQKIWNLFIVTDKDIWQHTKNKKGRISPNNLQSAGVRNRTSKPQNQDPNGQNLPLYARKLQSKNHDDPTVQTPEIDETLLLGFG